MKLAMELATRVAVVLRLLMLAIPADPAVQR
jgi:hypothetical protein